MADYSGKVAVHETLTANAVDYVALSRVGAGYGRQETSVTVLNRSGAAEIYFTVSATGQAPADPTVGGTDTYVVPAAIGSVSIPVAPGVATVPSDGNDVVVVAKAVGRAARRARSGQGPTVIEAKTYRQAGHNRGDPAPYRPAEEVQEWLRRDPLDKARARLIELGVPEQRCAEADGRAAGQVAAAVAAARAAPEPDPAAAFTDVWADGGALWRT